MQKQSFKPWISLWSCCNNSLPWWHPLDRVLTHYRESFWLRTRVPFGCLKLICRYNMYILYLYIYNYTCIYIWNRKLAYYSFLKEFLSTARWPHPTTAPKTTHFLQFFVLWIPRHATIGSPSPAKITSIKQEYKPQGLTPLKTNEIPRKSMVGRCVSYWNSPS